MSIVVLGATGGTGRELVARALAGGHDVRALVRNPDAADLPAHPRLEIARADVTDAASVATAIGRGDVVVSGLGARSRRDSGVLTAGASAVSAAHPDRIVWLGASGTGETQPLVNGGIAWMLRKGFGPEYRDKVNSELAVREVGGIVVHSGPLTDKSDDPSVTVEHLSAARRRFFPHGAPRASIARLMLDLAVRPQADPVGHYIVSRRRA